jgi:hypothetical protein
MRPLPNPHSLRGSTDARRPMPRPVRPPSPVRLVLLLVVTLGAIFVLLRRAGAL